MPEIAGVMCFSRTWSNRLMWAHYADQHRGICLGVDVPDAFRKEISYTSNRQPFPDDLPEKNHMDKMAIMNTLLFSKFEHSHYEDEIRVPVRLETETGGCISWTSERT
jgi:predicted SAM-dependent methyltransferase